MWLGTEKIASKQNNSSSVVYLLHMAPDQFKVTVAPSKQQEHRAQNCTTMT